MGETAINLVGSLMYGTGQSAITIINAIEMFTIDTRLYLNAQEVLQLRRLQAYSKTVNISTRIVPL